MRGPLSLVAAILPAALIGAYALAQPAPNTAHGVVTSPLCASVTAQFPKAPWCSNPQNGLLYVWNGSAYVVFNGIPSPGPTPNGCSYSHVPPGNATYGNNSPFAANVSVAQEQYPTGVTGKIGHISCQNLTGGTCSGNPPQFEAYIVRGGVEVFDSSPVVCSSTQQTVTQGPTSVAVNQAFQSGDLVGLKVSTQGSNCNNVYFDPDLLVLIGAGC